VASMSARGCRGLGRRRPFTATAAMLAATRGKGMDRMPPRGRTVRVCAMENEGQGLDRTGERSAAPQRKRVLRRRAG